MVRINNINRKFYINGDIEKVTDIKVYRYRKTPLLFLYESPKRLSNLPNFTTCYYNIFGKETVIKGQLIDGIFKPTPTDDTFFNNIDLIYQIKKDRYFLTMDKAIHYFLKDKV